MKTRIIKFSDILRCPATRLDVTHFNDDGSCKCDPCGVHGCAELADPSIPLGLCSRHIEDARRMMAPREEE